MVMLPAVDGLQHEYALYNPKGVMTPVDLKGKRVGIRSFTIRGHGSAASRQRLRRRSGLIRWITFRAAARICRHD
jgi:hypothetical protein